MAIGDLINELWEFELPSGYVFGGSNLTQVARIDGLGALPDVRTSDQVLLRTDGLWAGDDFLGGRTVSMTVEVDSTTDTTELELFLAETTTVGGGTPETEVAFLVPGVCGTTTGLWRGRLRRRSAPMTETWEHGLPEITVEWDCTDPRLYSATEVTISDIPLASVSGGLTWPLTWPLTWGAVQSGSETAANTGSHPAPVTLTVHGPVVAPRIENLTVGKTIASSISLAAGESLVIDTKAKTVTLGGVTRSGTLTSASRWWDLDPGNNTIRFAASSGTGTLDITWRSTWL